MAEYEPTPEAVGAFKRAWHEADAEGDEGNRVSRGLAAALAQHDAELRAEVERLREVAGRALVDRDAYRAELDEARQQVADLRARVMGRVEEYRRRASGYREDEYADGQRSAYGAVAVDLEALAGSGEQPDERARCSECGPGYRVGDEGCRHRPAPVVPDVVRELDAVMHHHADRADAAEAEADRLAALLDVAQEDLAAAEAPVVPDGPDALGRPEGDGPPHLAREWAALSTQQRAEAFAWFTRSLAVMGQGVTAEAVEYAIEGGIPDDLPGYREVYTQRAARRVMALLRHGDADHPSAAVRPSGQEGS